MGIYKQMEEVQNTLPKYKEEDLPFCIGMKCRFWYNDVLINGIISSEMPGWGVMIESSVYTPCFVLPEDIATIPEFDKIKGSKLFKLMYE
jgi:hypothetical protein